MADIHLESLHFTPLNLTGKARSWVSGPVLSELVSSSAKTTRCLYYSTLSNPNFSALLFTGETAPRSCSSPSPAPPPARVAQTRARTIWARRRRHKPEQRFGGGPCRRPRLNRRVQQQNTFHTAQHVAPHYLATFEWIDRL